MTSQPTADYSACHYTRFDEFIHEPPSEPGYNESVYFNFVCGEDQERYYGGLFRIALRPGEGYAELTFILAQDDGSTLFKYARTDLAVKDVPVGGNIFHCDVVDISVVEPTRRWVITYNGEARILPDLARFGDAPGVEWRAAERVDVDLRFEWSASHPMHTLSEHGGLHAKLESDPAARNHYEQWGQLKGVLGIGEEQIELKPCESLRDHSWGRRDWDSIPKSNQLMAFWDDGTRAVTLNTEAADGSYDAHGSAWLPGRDEPVDIDTFAGIDEYTGMSSIVDTFPVNVVIDDRPLTITAHVLSMFPTRVGKTHRDALALVRLSGDLGPGGAWIDLFRERIDREVN